MRHLARGWLESLERSYGSLDKREGIARVGHCSRVRLAIVNAKVVVGEQENKRKWKGHSIDSKRSLIFSHSSSSKTTRSICPKWSKKMELIC